ncbi:GRB10-interacting GYF protein 1 isoform X2 [Eublepharis macularius]|uniref:GRB10-interacting GYF protein 1 isoform X2 n=1 Tax=Eublepharis macularius TaxID=481883 RepID=A0AA97LD87_EUBMA|nr:GRB10-interacting GYF protein 1 isoform X2 [Eublepharis macularius]
MAAETLNFGPEWLRALSGGGSVTSPPPSPAMPKYKLAEYRYGREEMLALYVKDNKVPEEIRDTEFSALLQDDPLQPLALVPLTEEEQRNFSMSVNSVAVLRLMGKGGGAAPAGVSRGRGSARSRGRGRGESGFYQRSMEEVEGAFGRGGGREMHRSQSWDDRGERRFEKPIRREGARAPFEEGAPPGRKDFARSDSDNWRTLREEHEGEEESTLAATGSGGSWRQSGGARRESERWRSASPDGGPRSAGWREHGGEGRRRKFDFDFRDREDEPRSGRRHRHNSDSFEEDKDGLPEWCLEDEEEEMGTFDSSGAFMPLKKSPKEPIPEEQELNFLPLQEEEEEEEAEEEEEENRPEAKDGERGGEGGSVPVAPTVKEGAERERVELQRVPEEKPVAAPAPAPWRSGPPFSTAVGAATIGECESAVPGATTKAEGLALTGGCIKDMETANGAPGILSHPTRLSPAAVSAVSSSTTAAATEFTVGDNEDEDGMKHLQQEAEKMVASLQDSSLEEEHFTQAIVDHRNPAAALPLSHEAAMKWFYKDPQGEIQGPFTTQEMAEWFQAGYFAMSLLVKRGCDEGFQPLGEVIKMWGRVPFAPGPSPPPLLVRRERATGVLKALGEGRAPEQAKPGLAHLRPHHKRPFGAALKQDVTREGNMDQERLKKQQELAAATLYQQLQHQQLLQLVNRQQYAQCALQQKVATGDLTQQQLATFLQQLQALKPRAGEQGMIPSMNRSISVPDTGSLWDTHTSASSQAGGEASLWDIPISSSTQGPILEQLQLQHKLQERRGAELRAKRDEDERKRRREEEELFRRKQLPSSSSWGQQSVNSSSTQNSFSIADIQKLGDARACRELREECRQQELLLKLLQQQNSHPLWGGLAKQNVSMKALLELQQETERHMQKQQRAQQRAHGGHSLTSLPSQWGVDSSPLWGGHEKSSSISLWEESMKNPGPLSRSLGLKNSRSSPSLGDTYSASCRQSRKKTDEEEKLLKLLQGIHKPQDGFTQWCEQMLHALNTSSSLDVPTVVAFLKEVESPYDVHDCIRSYLGDTVEAKEFAKQFLERRAKQRANQQRQQQQQDAPWLSSSSLQSVFQSNHHPKTPSFENSQAAKIKRRPMMLHADPSILGYALHGSASELEPVEDY